ncbi:MAG: DJ-1/PfpI family protein [Eubacteriales bacterium]|nr:DJ-1/PfpI family protein [Eubacteriales bacterium]
MKKVIVFFADGFEECEGLIIVDILRRAGIETVTASVSGKLTVTSSHHVCVAADVLAEEADYSSADMVVLPGGMPGTLNLAANEIVAEQCRAFAAKKSVAAICAAPSVLAGLGMLEKKPAACYPGFEDELLAGGAIPSGEGVTVSGNIITGRALGSAIPFAIELVRQLSGPEAAEKVTKAICY